MDCLEFGNLQQLIFAELSRNIGECQDDPSVEPAIDLMRSRVELRSEQKPGGEVVVVSNAEFEEEPRVFMPASRVNCHISFAQLAIHLPDSHVASTFSVLVEILRDVPYIDFDQCLVWDEWSLPDQLVYTTVSALLRLATAHTEHREAATSSTLEFAARMIELLKSEDPSTLLTQYAPAFHGFYRAIISTSFPWTLDEWNELTGHLNALFAPEVVDRLNSLLIESLNSKEDDHEAAQFIQVFLARYVSFDRPLTGYFIVCCVTEILWTVLAQSLLPPIPPETDAVDVAPLEEAEAANKAWIGLSRHPVPDLSVSAAVKDTLTTTHGYAMRCFTDLLVQIENMDSEPSIETYAWETMSESLKLASVCSITLQDMDQDLYSRLRLLLSDESPLSDNLVQEAALKSTTVLVQNFPSIAASMSIHLRRFVTSPLPIFEYEFAAETRTAPPLAAAAKCLALCIELSPGDDFIMSNMYSLLNYITATSKDGGTTTGQPLFTSTQLAEQTTLHSVKTGLQAFTDDEKRLIGISTIAVVTSLTLEFRIEEVTRLTISMLLQRLRTAEPTVEAAIAYNLVDLAIIAPENAFVDIIKAFSVINRSANPDDPRFSNNMVIAAQTRLAQKLRRRKEFYDTYLVELLVLFLDKGVAIQNASISNQHLKTDEMVEQLGALLLPIDALLAQEDFIPHLEATSEIVTLFRNLWFLCVLFRFSSPEDRSEPSTEWQLSALTRIAMKTPRLVLEESHDYASSELEYNAVIRQEYAHAAVTNHRVLLTKHIPLRSGEIRYLHPGQILFLLAMYDLEMMRSSVGLPSSLPYYFVNESVNGHTALSSCMDSLAEKVIQGCISTLSKQVVAHSLPESVPAELRGLLICSCHRVAKAREVASKSLNRLITSFPSLMCDPPLVFAILEVLTLLRRACEGEYFDEYDPVFEFRSETTEVVLQLTDSYKVRGDLLGQLYHDATTWFNLALARAPVEFQSTLEKYLALNGGVTPLNTVELGASVALQFASALGPADRKTAPLSGALVGKADRSRELINRVATKEHFAGQVANGMFAHYRARSKHTLNTTINATYDTEMLKLELSSAIEAIQLKTSNLNVDDLKQLLFRCASILLSTSECDHDLLHYLVALPFESLTPLVISSGIEAWTWIIGERPDMEIGLMTEINAAWGKTIRQRRGLFCDTLNYEDPFYRPVEYSPTDKSIIDRGSETARKLLSPHVLVLQMLLSRFQTARYRKPGLMLLILRLVLRTALAHKMMSTHPLAREARFSFLLFGFEALKSSEMDSFCEHRLRDALYSAAFSWFSVRPQWSYGANRVQIDADTKLLSEFSSLLSTDAVRGSHHISLVSTTRMPEYVTRLKNVNRLLRLLVDNEIYRLRVWSNPMNDPKRGVDHVGFTERGMVEDTWIGVIRAAWKVDPSIAVHLTERFKHPIVEREVGRWVRAHTRDVLSIPEALNFVLGDRLDPMVPRDLKYVLLWAPVTPVIAVSYFEPRYKNDPVVLQYAHRVLEQHPVGVTFFFVPQIVQALRNDALGYVARFIFETAKISQLFCHQIIWNMKANCYKDDGAEVEDSMKPMLDKMTDLVVDALSGEAKNFYDREFGFFNEVTSISGKLKPYIKRSKPEKKAKIDEEMAKIQVEVGVYLPSNPDGVVVDIDKKSGRPLQSHAKAPFMATFKVRKEQTIINTKPDTVLDDETVGIATHKRYDMWQAAIFKVGDDCRQDVLALQVIAMFKNIFLSVGLNLYLFPYRVTATGPGCGVIDVVPNATSRDEMGRAKVNDLIGFFTAKYGGEDCIAFQKARLNFIQSMAAYSVACYILQIKDRHNGNIMIDGDGHIVHIDFGFLFDIGPGGIKFEPNSFKLNHEMVVLMGGRYSQGYALFQQLTIKAFLAIRPHASQIVRTVELMLGTDLPSFKGDATIKRLRDRFALSLNERQAADWMVSIVRNAHENMRSIAYDEFQRLQNGIPYK
ncbi:atypical/PIKK/PI4K protein kinase [Rickenella mellea]|uniref:1-phosphatidylinositol 4-kinase n=1 Tax=Rickenella mellea TaxID=50990 RepID=A0A4Y7QC77_9AGAM|nr:atypical/PIKK/PI4K protein kinase [Rickenella mellea]